MYKGSSQGSQSRFNRVKMTDAMIEAGRGEKVSKSQQRKTFARAMAELDRQIALSSPGSSRRKRLGQMKQELQRQREAEKGVGVGGGKANAKRISDIFREKIFDALPDDAQRIWDAAVADEAREREQAMANITIPDPSP